MTSKQKHIRKTGLQLGSRLNEGGVCGYDEPIDGMVLSRLPDSLRAASTVSREFKIRLSLIYLLMASRVCGPENESLF